MHLFLKSSIIFFILSMKESESVVRCKRSKRHFENSLWRIFHVIRKFILVFEMSETIMYHPCSEKYYGF